MKTPFSQLSPNQKQQLLEKLENRIITADEYRHLRWNRRMNNRRRRGDCPKTRSESLT